MACIDEPQAWRARIVFPISAPPLRDGVVTVAGERIVAVGENLSGRPATDLGDVAILPGLVNPHTHLEFSGLPSPLGRRGMSLPEWIITLVHQRRATAEAEGAPRERAASLAMQAGLDQCLACGVTTVGDIVTANLDDLSICPSPVRWIAFRELLGQTAERIVEQQTHARGHLQLAAALPNVWPGLSPHAPYSTARELVAWAGRLSHEHSIPVAMHVAESREELQLLSHGTGPLREMLQQLDAWQPAAFARRSEPRDYLELLAAAWRSLVVHGNYLAPRDWDFLAQHAARMAVVYCPRTHDYFAHDPYPLAEMLRRGARVVVGTDSCASSPDLDLWQDLRTVVQKHPLVNPRHALRMVTLDAAAALGCADEVGSLEVGKRADLACVQIHPQPTADPHDALWDAQATVVATMCGGRFQNQRRQQ